MMLQCEEFKLMVPVKEYREVSDLIGYRAGYIFVDECRLADFVGELTGHLRTRAYEAFGVLLPCVEGTEGEVEVEEEGEVEGDDDEPEQAGDPEDGPLQLPAPEAEREVIQTVRGPREVTTGPSGERIYVRGEVVK